MSQYGKRNYRPRSNESQTKKESKDNSKESELIEKEEISEQEVDKVEILNEEVARSDDLNTNKVAELVEEVTEKVNEEVAKEVQEKKQKTDEKQVKQKKNKQKKFEKTKEKEKAHYVFGRDAETGETKRIDITIKNEVKELEINNKKVEILNILLSEIEKSIVKTNIEIEIYERLVDVTVDPKKIELLDKKVVNFRTVLEDLEARKGVIKVMIEENN